ncbi:DUF3180 domain-containing protein [Corynebacterium sp. A21]|uniref:DUF3180 domain-containing protein n=1 Tax=Corynebacterium sp. A21 TaxID=3457318 RepID=UPI003FD149BD
MSRTPLPLLLGTGVFVTLAAAILTWGFYGRMAEVPVAVSLTLWVMAAVCVFLAQKVKSRLADGRIGQDNSQLNPVTAAQFLIIGKASAWTGAIIGGAYVGMATYIIPVAAALSAAAADLPGVVASATGGIALSVAGLYLERTCHVPPPTDGAPVG